MLCYGTIAFEIIFTAICLCVTLSQCSPLSKMWDLDGTVRGFCINTTAFFYCELPVTLNEIWALYAKTCAATSGINIITDLWIIALPIKTLRLINRPTKEKVALIIIFGAGTFAAIMSVVRLQSIYKFTLSADPFRDGIAVRNLTPPPPKRLFLSSGGN